MNIPLNLADDLPTDVLSGITEQLIYYIMYITGQIPLSFNEIEMVYKKENSDMGKDITTRRICRFYEEAKEFEMRFDRIMSIFEEDIDSLYILFGSTIHTPKKICKVSHLPETQNRRKSEGVNRISLINQQKRLMTRSLINATTSFLTEEIRYSSVNLIICSRVRLDLEKSFEANSNVNSLIYLPDYRLKRDKVRVDFSVAHGAPDNVDILDDQDREEEVQCHFHHFQGKLKSFKINSKFAQ